MTGRGGALAQLERGEGSGREGEQRLLRTE